MARYCAIRGLYSYYKISGSGQRHLQEVNAGKASLDSAFNASGFFASKTYIDLPDKYKLTNNAEYVIKFTTSNVSGTQPIWHCEYLFNIEFANNGELTMYNFGTKVSTVATTLSANTTYWVKVRVNGQDKTYSYSTNGSTWTTLETFTDTAVDTTANYRLRLGGSSYNSNNLFQGSIDLKETYINVDGKRVWTGAPIVGNVKDYDYKTIKLIRRAPAFQRYRYWKYKYWKYVWGTWTQPNLTANGTIGGTAFACNASASASVNDDNLDAGVYCAFDSNASTYWRSGTTTGWLGFYSPTPLQVSKLVYGYFYSYITGGNVVASDDNATWVTLCSFTNATAADLTINVNAPRAYKYYRINITGVNKDYIHCKRLDITATYNTGEATESTSSNYDYKTAVDSTVDDYDYKTMRLEYAPPHIHA